MYVHYGKLFSTAVLVTGYWAEIIHVKTESRCWFSVARIYTAVVAIWCQAALGVRVLLLDQKGVTVENVKWVAILALATPVFTIHFFVCLSSTT